MSNFKVEDLQFSDYGQSDNYSVDESLNIIDKKSRKDVLAFCVYIIKRNNYSNTIKNLHHIENLIHHPSVDGINNKKDLSYFIRRNWYLKFE